MTKSPFSLPEHLRESHPEILDFSVDIFVELYRAGRVRHRHDQAVPVRQRRVLGQREVAGIKIAKTDQKTVSNRTSQA